MSVAMLPNYIAVAPCERGSSFGVSFNDYRKLAGLALGITHNRDATMAIYKPDSGGAALDIFTEHCQLTIIVNSLRGYIGLLCSDLDSIDNPLCLLSVENCDDGWRRLGHMARKEIEV